MQRLNLCSTEVKGKVTKDLNLHKIAYRADLNSLSTYVPLFNPGLYQRYLLSYLSTMSVRSWGMFVSKISFFFFNFNLKYNSLIALRKCRGKNTLVATIFYSQMRKEMKIKAALYFLITVKSLCFKNIVIIHGTDA